MSDRPPLARPSGMAPPATAELDDGSVIELEPLARQITDAHLLRHPEDVERYGAELARAWGTHDNQHLLAWAAADLDLDGQLAWLARVLDARGYPVANLRDNVATSADIVEREIASPAGHSLAERLLAAGATLASG